MWCECATIAAVIGASLVSYRAQERDIILLGAAAFLGHAAGGSLRERAFGALWRTAAASKSIGVGVRLSRRNLDSFVRRWTHMWVPVCVYVFGCAGCVNPPGADNGPVSNI